MAKPAFINLWNAYPTDASPCDGPWDNQCAIRMSIALNGEHTIKVNARTYSEPRCAHDHARGAESLANWLWKHHLGAPLQLSGSAADRRKLSEKRGIIFFKDCFARAGQSFENRTGDHIDLWDRGRVTGYFADQAHRSKAVWFWELK
ncbi:type VI secretion system amidase effector protein Tae4 [Pseudomonas entomophila]|uniref:type VI secretion system amidase effector protein Tae4 n=1 Tax=Pseudomonas entomophila TaxID=312306 RepID=UPI0023D8AD7B|nr:type VI secretion system amidase effector protein Tae4 [Pseudomonas entomophila]MDF0729350.1 type VI secretion system amidase effector protein Tae4 [Pseudomonas entomophila]